MTGKITASHDCYVEVGGVVIKIKGTNMCNHGKRDNCQAEVGLINSDKVAKILKEQRKQWLGQSAAANEAIDDIEQSLCQLLPEADRQRFIDAARVVR